MNIDDAVREFAISVDSAILDGFEKQERAGSFTPRKSPPRRTPAGATWRRAPLKSCRARWQLIDDLGYLWATVYRAVVQDEPMFRWNCFDERGKLAEGLDRDAWQAIHGITSAMAGDPPWLKCREVYHPHTGLVRDRYPVAAFRADCGTSPPCGGCTGCIVAMAVHAGFETRVVSRLFDADRNG